MSNNIDSKDRIARSNIYIIFGKLIRRQIHNNDDGELLLKRAGLSKFVEDYKDKLSPYWYNRGYRNDNEQYNPQYACISICEKIEDDEESLLRFLNVILEEIREIDESEHIVLSNYLNVLGYEILINEIDDTYYSSYEYKLVPSTAGSQERNEDVSYLYSMLSSHHSDLVHLYDEAISNFGNGEYISCIDNCRSLFESFFKKLDTNNDYVKGILVATGEQIIDNGANLVSIKKIYEYWLANKKGANRFRLFQTMYSAMSGLGTHHEDIATKEDALLLLRYVEDCFLWCFRKNINL